MSFAPASQQTPGQRPGKQNRPRCGLRGSTEAPTARPLDNIGSLALRPVIQATDGSLAGRFHA